MEHARDPVSDGRATGGLDADQTRRRVHEPGERARGVRSAADTCHHDVGVGTVEDLELGDEIGDRRLASHPTPEPEAMSDATREVEHVE